jgi:hypothetical protein
MVDVGLGGGTFASLVDMPAGCSIGGFENGYPFFHMISFLVGMFMERPPPLECRVKMAQGNIFSAVVFPRENGEPLTGHDWKLSQNRRKVAASVYHV